MISGVDSLMNEGCETGGREKVCRSRGGESCAFDGAMIVLQPIADCAHLVHGPITCAGITWEGRGSKSDKGKLHKMGFTTDMSELDIIYGAEENLLAAIKDTHMRTNANAVFVYSTCVSGLTGEDIDAVCRKANEEFGIRAIPVNAPGFVGPKNLGNRIAGEVLLEHVIGTGLPPFVTNHDINLIGEYNIAGDLHGVEPLLEKIGARVLSRITGNSTFEEITYAHRAKLNVVVCSRALINVAKRMESRYGIPYIEVSFFGVSEMSDALRKIALSLGGGLLQKANEVIERETFALAARLEAFKNIKGKKAVLYSGGVKSWSFIRALNDIGIEVVAVGTKKSSYEDEIKMRRILGEDAPLYEDVTPKNLRMLMKQTKADMLIAGGRNKYLAAKEGWPFVDVNQERERAYAGYSGLLNFAEDVSKSLRFYEARNIHKPYIRKESGGAVINPLKLPRTVGAVMALQGVHGALPLLHGAQGCTFLEKVLLTNHFHEPIALQSTKLFVEEVVMGSEEKLSAKINELSDNPPSLIGVVSTALSEVKGDDIRMTLKNCSGKANAIYIPCPDYNGGMEDGYITTVEALIGLIPQEKQAIETGTVNVLAGHHLTPADVFEVRCIIEEFGLHALILPDLSCLDGSREGFGPYAEGGLRLEGLMQMSSAEFTLAVGMSMESPAKMLKERFGIEYKIFAGLTGLACFDEFVETLSMISRREILSRLKRQKAVLKDALRDMHQIFSGLKVCIAMEPESAVAVSSWMSEAGAEVALAIVPTSAPCLNHVNAKEVVIGDYSSIEERYGLLLSGSHGRGTADGFKMPFYEMGFPVHDKFGAVNEVNIGYKGTMELMHRVSRKLKEASR